MGSVLHTSVLVVEGLLGLFMLYAAVLNFRRAPLLVKQWEHLRLPRWYTLLAGVYQTIGALALLAGLVISVLGGPGRPPVGRPGSCPFRAGARPVRSTPPPPALLTSLRHLASLLALLGIAAMPSAVLSMLLTAANALLVRIVWVRFTWPAASVTESGTLSRWHNRCSYGCQCRYLWALYSVLATGTGTAGASGGV